jgi:hypothetical protein
MNQNVPILKRLSPFLRYISSIVFGGHVTFFNDNRNIEMNRVKYQG